MHTPTRVDAAFTATLAAALLALGVTAVATFGPVAPAEPALQVTMPAVTVVGHRATLETDAGRRVATAPAPQNEGSVVRKAS